MTDPNFIAQINDIDVPRLMDIFKESMECANKPSVASKLEPLECVNVEKEPLSDVNRWIQTAYDAIRKNSVGCILLAGGQGTRLGFDKPKGMYNIGLPSGKSVSY